MDYAFGLAKNSRLTGMAAAAMYEARVMHEMTGEAQRVFGEMRYRTLGSWSRERRVVAKAEHNGFGANPRFVVTPVAAGEMDCEALYEDFYCARGDMENRIKEQQTGRRGCRLRRHKDDRPARGIGVRDLVPALAVEVG